MNDLIRDLVLYCGISEETAKIVVDRVSLDPDFKEVIDNNSDGDTLLGLRMALATLEDNIIRLQGTLSDAIDAGRDALAQAESMMEALDMANEPIGEYKAALPMLYKRLASCSA